MFTSVYTNVTNHIQVLLWKPTQLLSAGRFSVVCHDQRSHGFFQAVQSTAIVKNGDREIWCLDCSENNAQQWTKDFKVKKINSSFSPNRKENRWKPFGRSCQSFLHLQKLSCEHNNSSNLPQGFLFQKHILATEKPWIFLLISCLNPPRSLVSINLVDPKQRRPVRMQMKPMNWML